MAIYPARGATMTITTTNGDLIYEGAAYQFTVTTVSVSYAGPVRAPRPSLPRPARARARQSRARPFAKRARDRRRL